MATWDDAVVKQIIDKAAADQKRIAELEFEVQSWKDTAVAWMERCKKAGIRITELSEEIKSWRDRWERLRR